MKMRIYWWTLICELIYNLTLANFVFLSDKLGVLPDTVGFSENVNVPPSEYSETQK